MSHIRYKTILFVFSVFCMLTEVAGQKKYLFIEPNISFSYDSTRLSVEDRYSNAVYRTEAYDFRVLTDTENHVRIHVIANHPLEKPIPHEELQQLMEEKTDLLGQVSDSTIAVLDYDKKVRLVQGFLCAGAVLLDKKTGRTYTTITCNHNSISDLTEIRLTSSNRRTLNEDYELLASFLKGFATYSAAKIAKEESLIKARYTVKVTPTTEPIEQLKWRSNNYFAIVSTKQPLKHKVKEVRLDIGLGFETFASNERGEVYIACSDTKKGLIRRKAELVLLTSFGKQVSIPFVVVFKSKLPD